jgi:hypothetical protein
VRELVTYFSRNIYTGSGSQWFPFCVGDTQIRERHAYPSRCVAYTRRQGDEHRPDALENSLMTKRGSGNKP